VARNSIRLAADPVFPFNDLAPTQTGECGVPGRELVMDVDLNMNVLIVDDFESMRETLHKQLSRLNFTNIDQAKDGAEALRKLRSGDYGLVISDWNMEPMDGVELFKEVRSDEKLKCLPFIMLTAETQWTKLMHAEEAGIEHCLTKPVTLERLKQELTGLLGPF
jgi:two-component system chemotaxis response regulator CheY